MFVCASACDIYTHTIMIHECACVYAHTYMMNICMCKFACVYTHTETNLHLYIVLLFIRTTHTHDKHMCVQVCLSVCMYIHTDELAFIRVKVYIYT